MYPGLQRVVPLKATVPGHAAGPKVHERTSAEAGPAMCGQGRQVESSLLSLVIISFCESCWKARLSPVRQ